MWTIPLSFLSGTLGRMGGAGKSGQWYDRILDTKWRDIGCSIVFIAFIWLYFGFNASFWWAYLLTFLLTFGAFTTYWDSLFGHDNLWFSGLMVGLAAFPLCFVSNTLLIFCAIRCVVLCISWGLLNKYIPNNGVLWWRRDVVEEFSRYAISL